MPSVPVVCLGQGCSDCHNTTLVSNDRNILDLVHVLFGLILVVVHSETSQRHQPFHDLHIQFHSVICAHKSKFKKLHQNIKQECSLNSWPRCLLKTDFVRESHYRVRD